MNLVQVHQELIDCILADLKREYSEKKSISRTTFTELEDIFHGQLRSALALVDRRRVKRVSCPSGRTLFQVAGETRELYVCLPSSNLCCCYSFLHQVLRNQQVPMCKHVLAARLAEAFGNYEEVRCSDETVVLVLKGPFSET